jgi:hypothetical protein
MPLTPENKAKAQIKKYLDTLAPNLFYFSVPVGPHSRAGISDIICCYQGKFLSIEVKSIEAYKRKEHGRSPAQSKFCMDVYYAGGHALTSCAPEGIKEYIELFMGKRDEELFSRRKERLTLWVSQHSVEEEKKK